ncbi:ATP-binding protein [Candidatus Woesearchaeota archaeon]|nr:ATP-binding protein [Candidatus Woesearchaeota archaeon]
MKRVSKMEAQKQIEKFKDLIEKSYLAVLNDNLRKDRKFLVIDFNELSRFDPELADILLEQPEDTIKAAEIAVDQLDIENSENTKIRFNNLPESQQIMIRNIRSRHLNKLYQIEGVVRQKSDVRPQVTAAKFECPSCGNVINVLQLDSSFKEPSRCGCGRKGKFRLVSKELVDAQGIVLEESPESLEGGEQPKRMNVFLKDDLVSPISEKKTSPGAKIRVVGLTKEVPIITRTGTKSTRFDLLIEANYVEPVEETFYEVEVTEEEERQIRELAEDPKLTQKLIKSIAPSIYGYEKVKEAILLQMMGGVHKVRKDGVVSRGDMHVLLVGDPGAGKCLDASSKIVLEDGEITSIKSFYEKNVSFSNLNRGTMKIFSINEDGLNFTAQPVRFWSRRSPEKMLKILTETGNEIIVTKEHPLFTTDDGLIFAKEAYEYKVGDYVATPSRINVEGALQVIPTDVVKSKSKNRVKYKIRGVLDAEFARLLGYLVGDGNVRFNKTTGVIRFSNNNQELLRDFEGLIKKLFDHKVTKNRKRGTDCWDYRCFSIELARILEKIDINITKKSDKMCICPLLCKSPNYVLKEFIRSLFDCEGHIRKDRREIEFSSKSKGLIYDLKLVLLRFGIISQISSALKCATNTKDKIKRRYYRLRISGKDVLDYYDQIGFVSSEKQDRLRVWKESKIKLNTNLNVVPGLKDVLRVVRKKYGLSQFSFEVRRSTYQHYEKGDRFPSYEKLRSVCKTYDGLKIKDPLIGLLNQIAKTDIFWDKIKSIDTIDANEGFVYDLEIEKTHNFIAGGVVVHNSALLKRSNKIAPKSRYISGKGVSGAGLTAAVVKDEFLKGWSLEAGAMVLASNGLVCIDEMDKISPEDRSAMHEAMENQTVSISKANIQATLVAKTTVLAAANPKFGRFDPYGIVAEQIDLPPTLINRFDLIFTIKDLPDEKRDSLLATHILNLHQNPKIEEPELSTDLLKKYIGYAKRKIKPVLSDGAIEEIKKYYLKMRASGGSEEGIKTIPISARQLEALVRLSEANARLRLSEEVTRKDAKNAISLLEYSLMDVGFDKETGKIDIDRIATGVSASARSHIITIKEIINELEEKIGKTIPIDDVVAAAKEKGINEDKVEEVVQKLKIKGDLYEPRSGFVSRI